MFGTTFASPIPPAADKSPWGRVEKQEIRAWQRRESLPASGVNGSATPLGEMVNALLKQEIPIVESIKQDRRAKLRRTS
jgi:hypothetical protein